MKLKTRRQKTVEKETDLELPIYLYFQDESCNDEYIKVTESSVTKVTQNYFGFTIDISTLGKGVIEEHYLRDICTKKEFDDALYNAIEYLKR